MRERAVHIIGRGIIGLSVAWEMACRGWQVHLVGPRQRVGSATWAAVGVSSVKGQLIGAKPLFKAKLSGHDFLRGWLSRLQKEAGRTIPHNRFGVLEPFNDLTGFDGIRERVFHRSFTGAHRVAIRSGKEVPQGIEALLGAETKGVFHYYRDFWFEPRVTLDVLEQVLKARGAKVIDGLVAGISCSQAGRLQLEVSGHGIVPVSKAILAAGWDSAEVLRQSGIGGLPLEPAHGETLTGDAGSHPDVLLRIGKTNAVVHGGEWWLGSTAFGANVARPDPRACLALPAFLSTSASAARVLTGTRARLRDRSPALGPVPVGSAPDDLWVALGFYKNGLQLGPLFAQFLANWIESGDPSGTPSDFRVSRFIGRP